MSGRSYGAVDFNNMADGRTDGTNNAFVELGIQLRILRNTLWGNVRRFKDLEGEEQFFVVVSLIALVVTIGFTIYKLVTVTKSDPEFTFALLLLTSAVFSSFYVFYGVLQERPTRLFIFSIAVVGVIIYLYIDYFRGKQQDVVELSSMVILILTVRDKVDTEDIVVLFVGGVVTLVIFLLGYYSVRNEHKIGTIVFLIACPLETVYNIYKLWQTSSEFMYPGLAGSTIACGAMALIVRTIVFITAILVLRNFNQGLKEKVFRSTPMQEANVQGAPDEVH